MLESVRETGNSELVDEIHRHMLGKIAIEKTPAFAVLAANTIVAIRANTTGPKSSIDALLRHVKRYATVDEAIAIVAGALDGMQGK